MLVWAWVVATVAAPAGAVGAEGERSGVTWLTQDDFTYGTYVIDQPGVYRLAEDISFNPNSPATLTRAVSDGLIPAAVADDLGLAAPVDAYHAGRPLPTQLGPVDGDAFAPGGPMEVRYDPAAFGVGFFAAIAVTADDVVIELDGHTIQQHPEHALLQRFFAVIELADQPFLPGQGPAGFGDEFDAARRVVIRNGTIGLSAHHGIHGNGAEDVTVVDVDFIGYEVAAIALNGVDGLRVRDVTATNRKDVPVLGTFSSAQFIKSYVDHLVRVGSTTTIDVGDEQLTASDAQTALVESINRTHHDLVADPNIVDGRPQIDGVAHPVERALFHNPFGIIDGNSYSFLVHERRIAVDGFPTRPTGEHAAPSRNISFRDVHVRDQHAFVNEIVALDAAEPGLFGAAAIDPVGAVFQVWNQHPDTGAPVTMSSLDPSTARYTGNPVANAQILVAKAAAAGDFDGSHLDTSRTNITARMIDWAEARPGVETLDELAVGFLCNGDSMFHVNKGVIGFKMDAAVGVRLTNTSVRGLRNLGAPGSERCGDYRDGVSHSGATLPGYGGAVARGYTFAGSERVRVVFAVVRDLEASWGSAIGIDVLTDSRDVRATAVLVDDVDAGVAGPVPPESPAGQSLAVGFHVGADAEAVTIRWSCAARLDGRDGSAPVVVDGGDDRVAWHPPRWCS